MREIEFRGKWNNNDEWVYGNLVIDRSENIIYIADYGNTTYKPVDPETVGEYTGLRDKNRVKIYEGDIVIDKEDEVIGYILWNKEEASFYFSILFENRTYEEEKLNDWVEELEVIGNIHDNLELLERKN